jgi:hypothetical protein
MSKLMRVKVVFHMLAPFDVFYQRSNTKVRSLIKVLCGARTTWCVCQNGTKL